MEIKYIDIIKTKRTKKIEELFKQSKLKEDNDITIVVDILEFPLEKVKEYCEKSNNNQNLNSEMEEFEKDLETYIKCEYRNLLDVDENNLNEEYWDEDEYNDESIYGDYDNRESNDEYEFEEEDEEKERKSLYCDADCGHCIGCRMAESIFH